MSMSDLHHLINNVEDFSSLKWKILWILFISKKYREATNESKKSIETRTWIFNPCLRQTKLLRDRYKSGIVIFEWRVTWNYAYSPFHYNHRACDLNILGNISLRTNLSLRQKKSSSIEICWEHFFLELCLLQKQEKRIDKTHHTAPVWISPGVRYCFFKIVLSLFPHY